MSSRYRRRQSILDIPDNLRGVIDKYSSETDMLGYLQFQEMSVSANLCVRATIAGVGSIV